MQRGQAPGEVYRRLNCRGAAPRANNAPMPSDTFAATDAGAAALFRHRPFLFFFLARGTSSFGYQMAAVAIGWGASSQNYHEETVRSLALPCSMRLLNLLTTFSEMLCSQIIDCR